MAFHDVQFPTTISEGYRGGPSHSTTIVETDSGHEERVSRWQAPRWVFRAERSLGTVAEINALRDFLVARGGALHSFRFKDWLDYTSEATGSTTASITATDQVIGTGDGSTTVFQLYKTYTSGSQSHVRRITLPVSGTVRVAVAGVEQTISTDFSVTYTTGAITFTSAPALGASITAGYQFDTPCRFGIEAEAGAQFVVEAYSVHSLQQIPIVEVKDETPYHTGSDPGGSYVDATMAADLTLAMTTGRLVSLTPSGAARNVYLPAPTNLGAGGPYFLVANNSGSYSITLRDDGGTSVATVGTNSSKQVWLLESGSTKTWMAF